MTRRPFLTLILFAVLVLTGAASAAYVLVNQRLTPPGTDTYRVLVDLSSADGVAPGLGQPVRVAGVHVGTIAAAYRRRGVARLELSIRREELPQVFSNARAALVPISPLKDMQLEVDPGTPDAGVLKPPAAIGTGASTSPASLTELLSALDGDTRDYLVSLISSVDGGTRGRSQNLRRALLTLGPTTRQLRAITTALDTRRRNLARLVHNLGDVTEEAADDNGLRRVVTAGSDVLRAIGNEQLSLDAGLRRLPGALRATDTTLESAAAFSRDLVPTVRGLGPSTRRLPRTLASLRAFATETDRVVGDDLRPLIARAQPVLRAVGPSMRDLRAIMPKISTVLRSGNYLLNELAFNGPGDDEGFLFWFPWWFHNYTSMFSAQDAHGSAARAMALVNCQQLTGVVPLADIFKAILGTYSLCDGGS